MSKHTQSNKAFKWFIAAVISGFVGAILNSFTVNNPHSRLIPFMVFFYALSGVSLLISLGVAVDD